MFTSPHLKLDIVNENKIALSISVTNSFLVQLREAHERTLLSYLNILNSHVLQHDWSAGMIVRTS